MSSSSSLTVYGYPQSRSVRTTWLLEELGQPYDYQLVDLGSGGNRTPAYLAINPGGKVPALRDGDLLLTESGAITNYLCGHFPQAGLIPPAGSAERAHHDQWSFFAIGELEQPLWTMGKAKFALPEPQRVRAILPTAEWEFQRALDVLSQGLGAKPYMLGERFQAVDILLGHTLYWAAAFRQPVEQANLQSYAERVLQRSALAAARAREQAALEARSD